MSLARHVGIWAKSAILWAGFSFIALTLVLAALGFLAAALFLWVATHCGTAAAAAITACGLLGLAVAILLAGRLFRRRMHAQAPGLFEEATGMFSMLTGLVGLLVRQDPKRAVLLALLAGALTEYFTGSE